MFYLVLGRSNLRTRPTFHSWPHCETLFIAETISITIFLMINTTRIFRHQPKIPYSYRLTSKSKLLKPLRRDVSVALQNRMSDVHNQSLSIYVSRHIYCDGDNVGVVILLVMDGGRVVP